MPADIVQAALADNLPAIGLTDHRLLTGSIEFVLACQKAGIQPVLGLEIDLEGGPISLLATSLSGWSSLCRLSSALALRANPTLASPLDMLATYSSDLIAISGVLNDLNSQWLRTLKDIYPNSLYLGLQNPTQALPVADLGRRLSLPLVVTQPVYYITSGECVLQRTLSAIRLNLPVEKLPAGAQAPAEAFFISSREIERRYKGSRAALAASFEIAERCKFALPLGIAHMPTVPLPPGVTAAEYLRQKAEAGARRIYGSVSANVQIQLDHELDVIARMGFEPIFLIVEEILEFARKTNVPFSSRGSAASSLVAHCLGITSPDPLRLDLYFERFLNPARTTPPDIDTDLCSRRRDLIIQHVFDTYGHDRVAMVGTINRFRPRSAIGEVAKAHGMAPTQVRELVQQLPYGFFARMEEQTDEDSDLPVSSFADLRTRYTDSSHKKIFEEAEALLKLPRHLSVHAGGLIVAPGPLTDLVPVMRSGSKGVIITQFDLQSVEELGLVKIDLLGIRGLTVLGDVADFIQAGQPGQFTGSLAVLESIPTNDPETSQRLESGGTIGCFQIESPGMRSTLREIHARSEDDLMAALALYRPGPLSGGLKDAFVRRFKGEEPVEHIHPALAPLLDETFGVILYQEQVLRIAHELAGFSLAEADLLRRAMSHFDAGRLMQDLEHKFVSQAQARSGVPVETAERIWEMMAAFAGYGFPKAHAASYAKVAWRSAWCKTHFPAEFMAAVLANWGGYYSQSVYLGEARRLGLTVRPPHVNYSSRNFITATSPEAGGKVLYMGLGQIRAMSGRTIARMLRGQPFTSLEDFLTRVDPRIQEAGELARVGAFEGFGTIPAILRRLQSGGWQSGQPSLFEYPNAVDEYLHGKMVGKNFGEATIGGDWTLEQKVAAQQELLGISLDAHPLELVAGKISAAGAIPIVDAAGRVGQRVTIAGIRQSGHRSRTSKGDLMLFMTVEDLSGMLDVAVFPDVYRQVRYFIHSSEPLLVTGVIKTESGRSEPLLVAEKVKALR